MTEDYTTVTEVPGISASREQLSMLYTRYQMAAALSDGKDALEVACGCGLGLGYLAKRTKRLVGGDYTEALLRKARCHYGDRVPLVRLDGHVLPFRDQSFDVVILYEAIYYLAQPHKFLAECRRVLRDGGVVLICTVNRQWADFNPSSFSMKYFAARELRELIRQEGFDVELYGGFAVSMQSARDRIVSLIKRAAVTLRLIPGTMKGKQLLKRLFFGKLTPLPSEVTEGMAEIYPLVPIDGNSIVACYKVLYTVGRL